MDLKTNQIKDLFKNCQQLYSFENYLVILTQEENLNWIHLLFFFTDEGELIFLEKITIDGYFGGLGNLRIISTYGYTMDFHAGKLVIKEDKRREKAYYNSLVGPTHFPELAEEVC